MKVITVSNIKGGSAKTTTSIFLTEALSRRGKTLVIDLDMQADLTDYYLPESTPESLDKGNIFRLLIGESDFASCVHKGKFADVIPGTIDLANLTSRVMQSFSILKRLNTILKENPDYDYVVIDTPGSARSELTVSLVACDMILIPVTPSKWAIRAVNILLDEISNAREITNKEHKVCFAPSMFGTSQKHLDLLERIHSLEEFKTFSPIPKSEVIKTNSEKRKVLKAGSKGWEAYDRLAQEVIDYL
ncbi:ParA family protein [Leptospira sp. GIMC2001]|uniref:ParA family protein n=1 Tax=Leptospira sp. GIMC2001 TaxID=1513297 RepID=UPI00234994E7|nr:ParA family protein [Leptospira sp. GIMC2001]WCL48138.1 ParA family protein [Leptospira sp. GIMC2001]